MENKKRDIVGDIINFRGLVYAPVNEYGVVGLFFKIMDDLNMRVELIKAGFPDCIGTRYIGNGRWERLNIEFEFKSRNFKIHNHDASKQTLKESYNLIKDAIKSGQKTGWYAKIEDDEED